MGLFENTVQEQSKPSRPFGSLVERRKRMRAPTLRSSYTAMTSNRWDLELVPAIALDRLQDDIAALATRSLEPNIFFDGTVLRAAWPRLTSLLSPNGCWMLCLWETTAEERQLRCFFPIGITKTGFPSHKVLTPLANMFMPIGTPLLDAENPCETAETLLRLLADSQLDLPAVLDLTFQREAGPTVATIKNAALSLGLECVVNNAFDRAALIAPKDRATFASQTLGKKRLRELKRQMRLMERGGALTFMHARDGNDVLDTFERFMTLELRSWKGRGGSALYNHKKIASFSRQIVAELAARDKCEIFWLKHSTSTGPRMVGGIILLGDAAHLVPWKMAYDESYASHSPGMQVMLQATLELISKDGFISADSLASSDHWMMNRLWTDRLAICDVTIALCTTGKLDRIIKAKEQWRRFHTLGKTTVKNFKRLLRTPKR